jgi:hypothetical protein
MVVLSMRSDGVVDGCLVVVLWIHSGGVFDAEWWCYRCGGVVGALCRCCECTRVFLWMQSASVENVMWMHSLVVDA